MRVGKFAIRIGSTAFLMLFFAFSAQADLYIEYENVSKNIPHQQDGAKIQKNYVTSSASRIETGDGKVIIVDYNSSVLYTVSPMTRSYSQVRIDEVPGIPAEASAAEREQLGKLMGSMMQLKVSETGESKNIEGYNCRKYLVEVAMTQGVYWVSKDVPGYPELKSLGSKLGAVSAKNPVLRQMNVAAMVDKLDGFPVQVVTNVMGGTVNTTLRKVEQKPLNPELFKVPKDFSLKGK